MFQVMLNQKYAIYNHVNVNIIHKIYLFVKLLIKKYQIQVRLNAYIKKQKDIQENHYKIENMIQESQIFNIKNIQFEIGKLINALNNKQITLEHFELKIKKIQKQLEQCVIQNKIESLNNQEKCMQEMQNVKV